MAPISLKIVLDEGAVVRTMAFDSTMRVREAFNVIMEKLHTGSDGKDYALFLTSTTDDLSGVWLEGHRTLEYYMLRDGDSLHCLDRLKNLRVRMLDGSVKTLQVDTSKKLGDLMMTICDKIGITNHDEYGLCREETKAVEEAKPIISSIAGTLTLKRKAQQKEKDAKMEQLSKKLKTDDNVEWLDQHKTLREVGVDSNETLLLKRRLFYSDRNVDSRDPVQLNLLYVQTRDAILEGRHPVTEEKAFEFAGLQCQIQHGDHQEDIHKPGLIENLNEYLPAQYSSTWGAEKKILKLHKKHAGLSQLEAKHLYTKTARELPTYGVTFFVVKEKQKGKKKLVPRLLGISSEAILRLDETTKEVLQAWHLTQVMTYHASHNDTFSLNFGDYSEKEYNVKTNDAYRIRDILEGYIDIIRKRLGAPYGSELPDSGTILQESVGYGRSNVITHVTHAPLKVIEHSYIGPSRIVQDGQAGNSSNGTQIMTVQQMLVSQRGTTHQQAVTGGVPMRREMSLQFTRKLNKMNANSVKIVTFLSDPNPDNLMEVQKILEEMEADMPNITQGVREVAEKQKTEEERNKLLGELDELQRLLDSLSSAAKQENVDYDDVQDIAKKIADLTTQMYLNLDPRAKKQSKILRTSRQSFIEDDKVEANLRRASFIVAAGSACGAIDNTKEILTKEHDGPVPTEFERQALEESVVENMGKINAALAFLLTSHSDTNNPDYSAAVISMITINELVPELAKDAKSLSSALDAKSRQALMEDLQALCNAARQVCALVGSDDKEKVQEATDKYSEVSGKLIFRFGRNPPVVDPEKSDEIIDLAKEAVATTAVLLMKVNELTSLKPNDDASARVDAEGVKCGDAARELLACAQLTAPSFHEPRCQSALKAAAENLSSSSQTLALAWKPLVEDPSSAPIGEDLKERTMDVAKALDRLKNAFANLQAAKSIEQEQEPTPEEVQRLRFITSTAKAKDLVKTAAEQLEKPSEDVVLNPLQRKELESSLTEAISQVNAAIASLIQAMSDPNGPDHYTAELAMGTISEVIPTVVKDVKTLSAGSSDKDYRNALLHDMKTWFEAVNAVCVGATNDTTQSFDDSTQQFAKASQKLSFIFSPRAHRAREQLLLELSSLAHERATALVEDSNKMADLVGVANASRLRGSGLVVDNAARALTATAQLTAPHIEDSWCRSALLNSTEVLSASARDLVSDTQKLQDDETGCKVLEAKVYQQRKEIENKGVVLETALQGLRESCWIAEASKETPEQKHQWLKFIASLPSAQKKLELAEERINSKPTSSNNLNEGEVKLLKDKLENDLVTLKSAVALLLQAKSDPHRKDFAKAEQAIATLTNVMPSIIDDTKAITNSDEKIDVLVAQDYLKALNDALKGICAAVEKDDAKDLDTSAKKLAEVSDKLCFVFHPRKKQPIEEQLATLCSSASAEATRVVEIARLAAQELDGVARYKLSEGADRLLDASDMLVTTAQLTSSCINEPRCKTALTSSADHLLLTTKALVTLAQSVPHQSCKQKAEELERRSALLKDTVNKIKQTVNAEDIKYRVPPPVPVKKSTTKLQTKDEPNHYQLPKKAVNAFKTSDLEKVATQGFLDTLRAEESINKSVVTPITVGKNDKKGIKGDKKQEQELARILQDSEKAIKVAIEELQKAKNKSTKTLLSEEQKEQQEKDLEEKLAAVSVAAASLLAAKNRDYLDYNMAKNSIENISSVIPEIAKDVAKLSTTYDDKHKNALLEEALCLCEGANKLCSSTPNESQKFNEAVVEVGDSMARLLYRVSPCADPEQEKNVIDAAKEIGDSAYKVAVAGADAARGADATHAQAVCDAGSKTAHTAGVLVYTAKLVASSIHQKECQEQLIVASKNLSSDLGTYMSSVKHLEPKTNGVTDLMKEAENLEKLLQRFQKNLGEGKLVKRKMVEKLVIEDTVLRQMAVEILHDAQARSSSTTLPDKIRNKYEAYCDKLADAIRNLDIANDKCHKMPDDLNKQKELESSIQMLQFVLLQSRPNTDGREQNNVVDLTDYVKEVSDEAEKLTHILKEINVPESERATMVIKDECGSIKQNAVNLINPTELPNTEDSLDGIFEVDKFGQDCDKKVATIKSVVDVIEDKNAHDILKHSAIPLSESINLLRFATKSALAVARSAALDETIDDLTDLQKSIHVWLNPAENNLIIDKTSPALTASQARLVKCIMDVSRGNGGHALASAVAAYVIDLRDVTPVSHGDRLKLHANKLIESSKLLVAATSTRVAMFETVPDAELIKQTQKVLQEIEDYSITDQKEERIQVINENDISKLLLPIEVTDIKEDRKTIADKLQKLSTKLNSLIGTVYQSASKPESLSRTVKVTVDTAVNLANTAKSLKTGDATKDKEIDECVDDMVWTTFDLFVSAERISKNPKNDANRRSLLNLSRLLNDSINKLARTANPTKNLKTQCSEFKRTLHMQEFLNRSCAQSSVCTLPYAECISELENQQNDLMEAMKLDSNEPMPRKEFTESLELVANGVGNSTMLAAHSAYLLSILESNKQAPVVGLVDLTKLRQVTSSLKDSALKILRTQQIEQMKAEEEQVKKMVEDLKIVIEESKDKIADEKTRLDLVDGGAKLFAAAEVLVNDIHNEDTDMKIIYSSATSLLNAVVALVAVVERPTIVPEISQVTAQTKAMSEVLKHSKELLNKTDELVTNVSLHEGDDDEEPMTWVTFNTSRKSLLDALEKLMNCLRENGQNAGLTAAQPTEDTETKEKSYLQIQVDTANKWLSKRPSKPEVKTEGEEAIRNILDIGEKMLEDLSGHELEEMRHLLTETEQLLKECSKSYDTEKARALIDKTGDLRKAIERCIVCRVVDDFVEAEEPMADLEAFVDVETDEKKRKFLLEQKIAELLAQLGKVKKTVRVVADVRGGMISKELEKCTQQTELLAPQLIKAAEERVKTPHNQQVVEDYRNQLAQYSESLSKVRDLCDRSVDPMEFVQTAGEKMQRLREESHQSSEPQRCAYTSIVIKRLANRVIEVGMSSSNAREDVEIMEVLSEAKKRLAAPPPPARASKVQDWKTTTAEILRATGEVESVLGGEGIFKKQPEPGQPIYNAALSLHTVVRDWSARDNEVVAVAKRMAVLMAKLSDYMNHDKKAELIATSKSIVVESHEVARLARKLALECSDIRIRTNLLQACERIPTISGQLKMLTTVKGSSLGHQRTEEDQEAMDMLVGNAQNLMLSVQDVVKGAESASVKIASQRGMRIKWVRKNYY